MPLLNLFTRERGVYPQVTLRYIMDYILLLLCVVSLGTREDDRRINDFGEVARSSNRGWSR